MPWTTVRNQDVRDSHRLFCVTSCVCVCALQIPGQIESYEKQYLKDGETGKFFSQLAWNSNGLISCSLPSAPRNWRLCCPRKPWTLTR